MARQHFVPTCEDFRRRFPALLRDELDTEWRGRVKGHVHSCEACALAFGDAIAQMREVLPAEAVRPVPQPPVAVLEAMGVRHRNGERVWSPLRTLANGGIEWAQRELESVRDAIETTLQFLSLPKPAWAHMGATHASTYMDAEVIDAAGQPRERKVRCEIVTPPTITKDGAFLLTVRTDATRLEGSTLLCTVESLEGIRVTFESTLQRATDGQGWEAVIQAEGLPACEEPVVIPTEMVYLSLQMK